MRNTKDWDQIVSQTMLELEIPDDLDGYPYLKTALVMTLEDFNLVSSITKLLYPDVAKIHKTTPSIIERAIRYAIEVSWERGKTKLFDEIFGYSRADNTRPTNSEYIANVALWVKDKTE